MPSSRGSSQPRDWAQVLLHCGQTLYCLSHQGSLRILEWVAYPFSRDLPDPEWNQGLLQCKGILYQLSYQRSPKSCLQGFFFDNIETTSLGPQLNCKQSQSWIQSCTQPILRTFGIIMRRKPIYSGASPLWDKFLEAIRKANGRSFSESLLLDFWERSVSCLACQLAFHFSPWICPVLNT